MPIVMMAHQQRDDQHAALLHFVADGLNIAHKALYFYNNRCSLYSKSEGIAASRHQAINAILMAREIKELFGHLRAYTASENATEKILQEAEVSTQAHALKVYTLPLLKGITACWQTLAHSAKTELITAEQRYLAASAHAMIHIVEEYLDAPANSEHQELIGVLLLANAALLGTEAGLLLSQHADSRASTGLVVTKNNKVKDQRVRNYLRSTGNPDADCVLFYDDKLHEENFMLGNFYKSPIQTNHGSIFQNVEAAYQSGKTYPQEAIEDWQQLRFATGDQAWRIGRQGEWNVNNIDWMRERLREKFTQHPQLAHQLLETGESILIEDSNRDNFWGIGKDGTGQNMLGQLLMQVRAELRNKEPVKLRFEKLDFEGPNNPRRKT